MGSDGRGQRAREREGSREVKRRKQEGQEEEADVQARAGRHELT